MFPSPQPLGGANSCVATRSAGALDKSSLSSASPTSPRHHDDLSGSRIGGEGGSGDRKGWDMDGHECSGQGERRAKTVSTQFPETKLSDWINPRSTRWATIVSEQLFKSVLK